MSDGPDRRVLLARFNSPEGVPMLGPEDQGEVLLWKVLYAHVVDAYGPAVRPWPDDAVDLVHDVRVACRRLGEALELTATMLKKGPRKKAEKHARRLRRALGAGREADVMRSDLERLVTRAGLTPETAHSAKFHGTGDVDAVTRRYPPEALIAHALDVLTLATRPTDDQRTLRQIAGPHLARRAREAEPLLDAVDDPDRLADQHRLRIRFKRLRYTVELIGPAFPDVIDRKVAIKMLKSFQDALGEVNDMKDLAEWLHSKRARKALGERACQQLQVVAAEELALRTDTARTLVRDHAPPLIAELMRAAGLIGPITL